MARQSWQAVEEADLVFFLVDGREGPNAADEVVAEALRRTGKPRILVVNKTDGIDAEAALLEFHALGLGEPVAIAAVHGRGVAALMSTAIPLLPEADNNNGTVLEDDDGRIRVAIVGRPNVGKSTLINRILGEERVLAFDQPGTTRDSIFIPD